MNQYRIAQGVPSGKYRVQQKSGYLPFWRSAFWQNFDSIEDAQSLLSALKVCGETKYPRSKQWTCLKISNEISRLIQRREFLNSGSFFFRPRGKASSLRLGLIEQRLGRLCRIQGKLVSQGAGGAA
jgi:hypothetical protein